MFFKKVLVGEVKSGKLKIGMKSNISGKEITIKSIEMDHESVPEATTGNEVGLIVSGANYNELIPFKDQELTFKDN